MTNQIEYYLKQVKKCVTFIFDKINSLLVTCFFIGIEIQGLDIDEKNVE